MRTVETTCLVDIENTNESLHAHAIPEGVEIRPGDSVLVHGAPSRVAYGEKVAVQCAATVTRAGALGRYWTYLTAPLELLELFEVGFQAKDTP